MKQRITPENITKLKDNEIFVFGSNEAGRHGKGAAKQAMKWGARYGDFYGRTEQTFAIPTLDKNLKKLTIREIERYINYFYYYAKGHPGVDFLVTKIGCGLADFKVEEIALLFVRCSELKNVYLPIEFWDIINDLTFRCIIKEIKNQRNKNIK